MTGLSKVPGWIRVPRKHPAVLPFTYAAVLIAVEAGLVQNHHVLAGAIVDAALVLILVNAVQDPVPVGGRFDAADAAMRALAVVALSRVIVIGLPLRDASLPLATIGVAALVAGATLGIARVTEVSIRSLLVMRSAGMQRQAAIAGFALGLAAYLVGAPRLWASGAPPGRVILGLVAGLVAACVEELLFRGLLLVTLQRVAVAGGLVASSGLFAATYLGAGPASLVLVLAIAGVIFGSIVARSGSLRGALTGHALLALGAGGLWPAVLGVNHTRWEHSAAVTIVLALVIVGVGAFALHAGSDRAPVADPTELPREALPRATPLTSGPSLASGHVRAVTACVRRLDLPGLLDSIGGHERDLCVAVITQLLISKASTAVQPVAGSLALAATGTAPEVESTGEDLAAAMRWLGARQESIEARLVARHLPSDNAPPVYDIRVAGGEIYGVLSDSRALALAVRRHPGFPHDPSALVDTVRALRASFGVRSLIVTADQRAMRDVDLSLVSWAPGWVCALSTDGAGRRRSVADGERLIEGQIVRDAQVALRVGGTAAQQGNARVISMYREVTNPELRFTPLTMRDPDAKRGALTATMLSAYVAWHLRAAWSDLPVIGPSIDDQPLPDPFGAVLAALAMQPDPSIRLAGTEPQADRMPAAWWRERAMTLIDERVPAARWRTPRHAAT